MRNRPTEPIPFETNEEIARRWRQEQPETFTSSRPTRDIRPPQTARSRATTEVMPGNGTEAT